MLYFRFFCNIVPNLYCMNNRTTLALQSFRNGLNCSQSVFASYSETLGLDKDTALMVACGFGAGMGRMQETCGAVTGAYMVLSVFACRKNTENTERKTHSYAWVRTFSQLFAQRMGSTQCRTLLQCDLQTEEGQRYANENMVFENICEPCITTAIELIDTLTQYELKA